MTNPADDIRTRSITAAHIADLIRIGIETNLSPWTATDYLNELQTSNSIMLALEEASQTVGFVVGRIVPGQDSEEAEIYNIAVAQERQRKGLGQLLFDEFMSRAAKHDVANVWLEVRASNEKAIRFYTKNGFEPVQNRPNFYENPREHAILMRLSLKEQTA
jgi:[ribosomal protein S18]-alanine N-acetyltransferase